MRIAAKSKAVNGYVQTSPLSRVSWKEGSVLAFETLNGIFVLGQLVGRTQIAFFNCFAKDAVFRREAWESASLLYVTPITKQFLRGSTVFKTDLTSKSRIPVPKAWINCDIDPVYKPMVLWEGTRFERRLKIQYSGALMCHSGKADYWPCKHDFLIRRIRINDRRTIDNHELSGSAVYPYSNHRLHLCYLLKRNADPLKELYFRRPIPLEYRDVVNGLFPNDHI